MINYIFIHNKLDILYTISNKVFQDVDWALLIGAKPRGPGMERADLLDINGQIFAAQVPLVFPLIPHMLDKQMAQLFLLISECFQ